MKYNTIIGELTGAVNSAKNGTGSYIDFYESKDEAFETNQFLFFMKPELTTAETKIIDFGSMVMFFATS